MAIIVICQDSEHAQTLRQRTLWLHRKHHR